MPDPNVTVQGTPNPNAAKFTVDRALVEGGPSRSFFDRGSAQADPLARAIFDIDGVESVLIADDFVTVTKSTSLEWDQLVPLIEKAIKEVLS
ncbi:MAG: NifU N-terminal domain-containing protein [Gemmatimonadota bacterium]|nr:MAG: NifU N-terminal domain-containing protein [Gemmatimonadota bacterium]